MKFSMLYTALFSGILALFASLGFAQNNIEWNFNGAGRIAGNGCPRPADTLFIPAGNEFSIIFTRMQLRMDEGPERALTLNCRGRIPLRIRGDTVVEEVEQTLSYSWAKTVGSRGNIFARNTLFGRDLVKIDQKYGPEMEDADALEEIKTTTRFVWACSPNTWVTGFFGGDFGLAGQRDNPDSEAINLNLVGQDFKYKIKVYERPGC